SSGGSCGCGSNRRIRQAYRSGYNAGYRDGYHAGYRDGFRTAGGGNVDIMPLTGADSISVDYNGCGCNS
ncbi:MAG: hypothetical protein Q4C73_11990, partial [Eubacteriales bacterium]|nr:hypothetical protein [Eubacteriales bacterium]